MSDEEGGSNYGAKYLVENHASQFANVRYALGEFGGFSFYVGKKKFYPIMVAEKPRSKINTTNEKVTKVLCRAIYFFTL